MLPYIKKVLLSTQIKQHLQDHAIQHVWVTGSVAVAQDTDTSDIDLIVQVDEKTVGTDFFELPIYLEQHLGRKVDLIDREYMNKYIKEYLLAGAVQVW